jgi:hypothetical protein
MWFGLRGHTITPNTVHAHVRVVGEGPGRTGPIGPSQLTPHALDLGLAWATSGQAASAKAIVPVVLRDGWWCLWKRAACRDSQSIDVQWKELP